MQVFLKNGRQHNFDRKSLTLWRRGFLFYGHFCSWLIYHYYKQRGNISSRFSKNSEASASTLLGRIEETYIMSTTWTVVLSNIQPLTGVLHFTKRLKQTKASSVKRKHDIKNPRFLLIYFDRKNVSEYVLCVLEGSISLTFPRFILFQQNIVYWCTRAEVSIEWKCQILTTNRRDWFTSCHLL